MKRPSFQFYPSDWDSNPNLKRCSFAEKGIWIDIMCLMHDQAEYGVLRWRLAEIAEAVGCKVAQLKSLERKGVLKGSDSNVEPFVYVPRSARKNGDPVLLIRKQSGPLWYCSRMVKDEYVRTVRGDGSRFFGGNGEDNGETPKVAPKPGLSDGSSSSSSSSSSSPSSDSVDNSVSAQTSVPASRGENSIARPANGSAEHDDEVVPGQLKTGPNPTPQGAMAVALRNAGVNVTSDDPILLAWIPDFTIERMLEGVGIARISKPHGPIGSSYLDKVMRDPKRTWNQKPSSSGNGARALTLVEAEWKQTIEEAERERFRRPNAGEKLDDYRQALKAHQRDHAVSTAHRFADLLQPMAK